MQKKQVRRVSNIIYFQSELNDVEQHECLTCKKYQRKYILGTKFNEEFSCSKFNVYTYI